MTGGGSHASDGVRPDQRVSLSGLLAATTVGVYLLVIAGATTALSDAAAACGTWPTCEGPVLGNPALAVAWGHRLVALLVGVSALAALGAVWAGNPSRRVRTTVTGAVALYPVQVAIGAATATAATGTTRPFSLAHLVVGVAIFGLFALALAWHLETETATPEDHTPVGTGPEGPDPDPVGVDNGGTEEVLSFDPATEPPLLRARRTLEAYVSLTKPRLMWLLCLVAAAGMALAAGATNVTLDARTFVATLLGGVLAIGASGTFNHVLERDIDRRMNRTADRPLATDRVGVRNAVVFGFALAFASVAVFASINPLAAGLGVTAILFYSVVYTLVLKPNTVQNTVLGGAAGALPALIGWAAVTGNIGVPGLLLAGVVFLWTPAHFYNLALAYKDDYARGGFPMLPVVRGEAVTRKHILYYLAATLVGALALAAATDLGSLYAGTSAVLGGVFLYAVVRLHRERTEQAAMRSFHAANAYLGALLVAVAVDAVIL